MNKPTAPFAALLNEALTQPGVISQAYSAFYQYSIGNQIWVWAQLKARNMDIGPIATFKKWQEKGRQVRKGEKALCMVMPVPVKKTNDKGEDESFVFFTVRNNWFALSQTEGEDFAAEVKTPEWNADQAMENLGISQVKFDMMNGNVQGYAIKKTIAVNPVAQYPHKTRIHEIAHVVLGHTADADMVDEETPKRDIMEVEAESVAYILCSILGLPGLEESRGYIQNWLRDGTVNDKTAQRIFNAANKILNAGKPVKEETEA